MVRVYSAQVSIPSSTILFGFAIDAYRGGDVDLFMGLMAGAIIWLIVFLVFRRQKIDVEVSQCSLSPGGIQHGKQSMDIHAEGWIKARQTEELLTVRLLLLGGSDVGCVYLDTHEIHIVDSMPRSFAAVFPVPVDILEEGRGGQTKGQAIDIGRIYVKTKSGKWLSPLFTIPSKPLDEGGLVMRIKEKLTCKRKLKGDEPGITEKDFHRILKKASQPIKKE